MIRVELVKLLTRPRTWITILALNALPTLVAVLLAVTDLGPRPGTGPPFLSAVLTDGTLLQRLYPRMVARDFAPQGYARQLRKDLEMVNDFATAVGTPAPMLQQSLALYRRLIEAGHAYALDHDEWGFCAFADLAREPCWVEVELRDGAIGQGILAGGGLLMVVDLLWRGLTDVDEGRAVEVPGPELGRSGGFIHGRPPVPEEPPGAGRGVAPAGRGAGSGDRPGGGPRWSAWEATAGRARRMTLPGPVVSVTVGNERGAARSRPGLSRSSARRRQTPSGVLGGPQRYLAGHARPAK